MKKLVLVHGSWSGSWVWDRLRPHLDERGLDYVAVDLPGNDLGGSSGWRTSLAERAAAINEAAGGPAILLGHSAGGIAVSHAAAAARTPHTAVIYLAAYLPKDRERLMKLGRGDNDSKLGDTIKPNMLKGVIPTSSERAQFLYSDYDGDDLDELLGRHEPEPLRPGMARFKLTQVFDSTPKYYIRCANDRAISPAFQDWMCSRYDLTPVASLESGHMPMLTMPETLAITLEKIISAA